jgi:hypothetical protein
MKIELVSALFLCLVDLQGIGLSRCSVRLLPQVYAVMQLSIGVYAFGMYCLLLLSLVVVCQCLGERQGSLFLSSANPPLFVSTWLAFGLEMYIRVEWFAFFEKFKNPVVLKVAYVYHNQLLFYNFLEFWDLPLAHPPGRLKNFIVESKF